jgi:DNA repair protein RadC
MYEGSTWVETDGLMAYSTNELDMTGSLTSSLVHPREVYTAVLNPEWRAAAIIFVHNRPSGDPQPSQEDIELTRRLKEIADLFGIRLNDHVILGRDRYYSVSDRGHL